jgi:hypothetical protein
MTGAVGVAVSAAGADDPRSLVASPLSLAEAMTSADYACQQLEDNVWRVLTSGFLRALRFFLPEGL